MAGRATTEIIVSQANNFHGQNIVLAYSCNKKGNDLDCHGDNYMAASFNLEFTFPQQPTTTATGQAKPASPAQAAQPSSGVATTTNTECPNLCNMQPGISYKAVFGSGLSLGQPRQCVLAKKYNPSTGQVYTGTSPGICQGQAKVTNFDLSSINSPRYNYFMSATQEVNVPCECRAGVGYVI
ncbi:hypothetical protein HYX16_01590 [Candidatus Woesearchaeota archaeon]|nr:hypothetical protein [Candidatus Woesearchaeota archaeon]